MTQDNVVGAQAEDAAIQAVLVRFPDLHPTPAMLGFARACVRETIRTAFTAPLIEALRVSPADAFEMGFAWAMMLRGQTMEDSRAVGRTLRCDLFDPIAAAIERAIQERGFNSFASADAGIVEAKAIVLAALRAVETSRDDVVQADREAAPLIEALRAADAIIESIVPRLCKCEPVTSQELREANQRYRNARAAALAAEGDGK